MRQGWPRRPPGAGPDPEQFAKAISPFIYDPGTPAERIEEDTAVRRKWYPPADAYFAQLQAITAWEAYNRLGQIAAPTLVIHGDADRVLPITASGLRTVKLIKGARQLVVKDGPHCITWTHAEEVNAALVSFFGEKADKSQKQVA